MSGKKNRLVLFDAHAILHRAFHALPEFVSSKGEPTGALYGLSTMLIKIIQELKPDYVAAAYDLAGATYRHEAYEQYKAGRSKIPDDLSLQIDRSRKVFEAFCVPIYEAPGFEADDVLGTIVEQMKNRDDLEIVIASGDMDTLQLIEDRKVMVYTLRKGLQDTVLYDEKAVEKRFGFNVKSLPDYKGLRGDPSDNIPGIAGIGDKTATTLIQNFESIDGIYKTLEKEEEKFTKAGIKARIVELLKKGKEEAEFSKMLSTIRRDVPIVFTLQVKNWRETFDFERINALFSELEFRTLPARIKEVFFAEGVSGATMTFNGQKTLNEIDQKVPEKELKEISIGLWLLQSNITTPNLSDILNYAKTKDWKSAREKILEEIEKKNLSKVFKEIELPLLPVIEKMEKRGVKIDASYLKDLSKEFHKELEKIEKEIFKLAGEEFNINSPKQLGAILYDKLNLTVGKNIKKTEGGARSTRESELQKLLGAHPIIAEILKHREFQKLLSTYVDNIPPMLDQGFRLHTTLLQAGTTTGRMSSENPNLQNIPIKTELGRKIRKAFVAEKGFKLVAFDYSQIELRIAAFLSEDEKLIEIFKSGADVHTAVASEVFNVEPQKVDYEMRRRAKVINFGIIYGMGINALRQNLGTDRAEAQKFYDEYFSRFKGLSNYLDKIKVQTEKRGFTETFFGRRRYFEGIKSPIPYIKAAAERMAINAPIQGTEADIIKLAMVRADEWIRKEKLEDKVHLLLQVHDELLYEIEERSIDSALPEIKKIMESVLTLEDTKGVPIIVESKIGNNWAEVK